MNVPSLHAWNLTPSEAITLQKELAPKIDVHRPVSKCELIAGADCSYNRFSPENPMRPSSSCE